eukprot:scaffold18363_cov105-Skeletonema_dohrnii-CCMP3373.AAC.4
MANYDGSLEAVDCHIHSVRYDMVLENSRRPSQMASSGHLQRCSDADTTKECWSRREIRYCRQLRSLRRHRWPHQVTYNAVATPIQPTNAGAFVRYDMVLENKAGGRLRCLIRSPATL